MQSLRSRIVGLGSASGKTALDAELSRATQADSVNVPENALVVIVQATHDADDRRSIMRHVHGCLNESASAQWRRVYSGLIVVERLLAEGAKELVSETANGMHFDLVQRLSFLEKYEYNYDTRVENLLRGKATFLRNAWRERQEALERADEEHDAPVAPANVGRDAAGELVGDEPAKRPQGGSGRKHTSQANSLDGSTTDGESSDSCQSGNIADTQIGGAPAANVPSPPVDLLDFEDFPACAASSPSTGSLPVVASADDLLSVVDAGVQARDSPVGGSGAPPRDGGAVVDLLAGGPDRRAAAAPTPVSDLNLLDF